MAFKPKYTDEMILEIIDKKDNMVSLRNVSDGLGCSKLTADNRLKSLIASHIVQRVNVGTDKKPFFIYKRGDKNV